LAALLARAVDFVPVTLAVVPTINFFDDWQMFLRSWAIVALVSLRRIATLLLLRTTPGRWLLGVRQVAIDGGAPSRGQLVTHEGRGFFLGMAAGIPVILLLTMAWQFLRVRRGRPTTYDGAIRVTAVSFGQARRVGTVAAGIAAAPFMLVSFPFAVGALSEVAEDELAMRAKARKEVGSTAEQDGNGDRGQQAAAATAPPSPGSAAAPRLVLPDGPGDSLPIDVSIPSGSRMPRAADACDREATRAGDPYAVAPPVRKIDKVRALTACEAAVRRDPANPRAWFHYGLAL
jgi:hypothetical protein